MLAALADSIKEAILLVGSPPAEDARIERRHAVAGLASQPARLKIVLCPVDL
jgi:hypothetical protein